MYPSFRILILVPENVLRKKIENCLHSKHYSIDAASNEKSALAAFSESAYNLVVCQDKLKETTGFRVYRKLEEAMEKSNTAFFMVLEKYSKEDVQFGLELGIDNFIFTPIDETSLRNKVDKLYKKMLRFNYYETPRFQEEFHRSPIPMFFSENFRISETNEAFSRFFDKAGLKAKPLHFNDLFDLNGNEQNHRNLRKLENGLIDQCWLEGVEYTPHPKTKLSLYKSIVGSREENRVLTILVPNCGNHANKHDSDDCPVYGTCLKHADNTRELDDAEIHLTPRETEIFNLSARGVPLKQIAAHLKLSQRTVEKHRSNIMHKTDTHSMMEAILKIRKNRI